MKSDGSQEKILYLIKTKGPQTVGELAQELNITTMGVRQHLELLEKGKMLKTQKRESRRGRPGHEWRLTRKGHRYFPDRHEPLTVALIRSVKEVFGQDGLERLIEKRTQDTLAHYHNTLRECHSIEERVARLAQLRAEEGYMAQIEREGDDFLLFENHCPICAAAEVCLDFCRSELETFQVVLGDRVKVERTEYILAGEARCAYRIHNLSTK